MSYKGLESTKEWFEQAIPSPTLEIACVQIGCHLEEVSEMLEALELFASAGRIGELAVLFKQKDTRMLNLIRNVDLIELTDSLIDQQVTATGVMHNLNIDALGALAEVNRSNFSKFEDGKAVFDKNGKIKKGKHYTSPDLSPYV